MIGDNRGAHTGPIVSFSSAPEATQQPASLRRTLSFYDLVIYGLAYVAPTAPITTIGFVWQSAQGLIVLAYVLAALCMFFTAKSYALMTESVPSAGSVYGFARHALGPFAGFIAGWMILLDYVLIPSYIYVMMAVALGTLMPQVDRAIWILALGGVTLAINWYGLRVTSRVNLISVTGQLAIVLLLIVCACVALHAGSGAGGLTWRPLFAASSFHIDSIFAATSICVMSFLGFDAVSTLAEEVESDNRRTVGRAILSVLGLSAALFAMMAWVLGDLMSGFVMHDPAAAIFDLSAATIGSWMAILLAWSNATLVGFTNALPMQVGVARILYAMGRDHQLPIVLSRIHPRHRTPYVGMIVTTVLSIAVAIIMRNLMDQLVSVVNFGALSGFLLLHCSVIALFMVKARSRRWLVHLVNPLAGIAVVLAVLSGMSSLAKSLGITWLIIGLAYGALLTRRRRTELRL